MTTYYAYVEDFKRFMAHFRQCYPELYEKYKSYISLPERGMLHAALKEDAVIRPTTRRVLMHIIIEFYIVRYN